MRWRLAVLLTVTTLAPSGAEPPWAEAAARAEQARPCWRLCRGVLDAWWALRDPATGLLPQRLNSPLWTPENAAADLYPFLYLAAHLLAPELEPDLLRVLRQEILLSTRVGMVPDTVSLQTRAFHHPTADLRRLIFGASEYCKDGLLPLWELLGPGVWQARLEGLVDQILELAPITSDFGRLPADDTEVNGEMLQVLSRLACATGDRRYLAAAEVIGDAWLFEAIPRGGGLPCHRWDFAAHRPLSDSFSLNDHGNEIVGGLTELYCVTKALDPARAATYEPALRALFDKLLATCRNADGLWVSRVEPSTGRVLVARTPDTWGYALAALEAFALATGDETYRDAVRHALRRLNREPYTTWPGADDYADSIEGALLLDNRHSEPTVEAWLRVVTPKFLARQQPSGLMEGWYGDGNSIRTALMLALRYTRGCTVAPWREDVRLGAVSDDDGLHLHLSADRPWSGVVRWDLPRHRTYLRLPFDYPRLNQFPEWSTVEPTRLYVLSGAVEGVRLGEELIRGEPLAVEPDQPLRLTLRPLPGPPYGERSLDLTGPAAVPAGETTRYTATVTNRLGEPATIALSSDWGVVEPAEVTLEPGARATVTVTGRSTADGAFTLTARAGNRTSSLPVRLLHEPGLVGYWDGAGETYAGETYAWCGAQPLRFTLPARPGRAHELRLRWGAKNDLRRATVTIAGRSQTVERGGYDGYEWLVLPVPAELVTGDTIEIILTAPAEGKAAFVAEARLVAAP